MQIRVFLPMALALCFGNCLTGQAIFDSTFVIERAAVFFDVNKHDLQPGADTVLAAIAAKCLTTNRRFLEIEAHTDADGSDGFNQELSERRAETVRGFLTGQGVPAEQMRVVPFGEHKPVASNASDDGKQKNRRATVELWQRTRMTWLKGQVVDMETKEGIPAMVSLRSRFLNDSIQTDSAGHFSTPVPDRMPVEVSVFSPGYFFETQILTPNSLEPIQVEFPLPPALAGEVLTLKNFYFVGNQDTLLPKSEPELPKLLKFMQFNPGIRIEIAGHINLPNSPPGAERKLELRIVGPQSQKGLHLSYRPGGRSRTADLQWVWQLRNGIPPCPHRTRAGSQPEGRDPRAGKPRYERKNAKKLRKKKGHFWWPRTSH
ncbi:MAG: OmpA family protein [Saprospirales bacterium]|nr:OmpA family protein [Saprospirales bacterium]